MEGEYPGFVEFEVPTICIVNGKPVKRNGWDAIIASEDIVQFITIPDGPFILIAIVLVVAIVALTFAFSRTPPKVPGEAPASAPVFSTKGQTNEIRLGEPIESCYGRNRIYPSYATRPYFQYTDNDQFQYALFCIGQGSYDIAAIQIGDTPIGSYQEVQYQIIQPGGTVTLFPTNVITSIEAGGQELFAPNQPEYVAPGWVGPFPANPSGSIAYELQIDLIFPKGIYVLTDSGDVNPVTMDFEWQARLIDAAGAPLGSFFALTAPSPKDVSGATTTPQRMTFASTVSPGRYEVRIRRTDNKNLSYRAGNDMVWEGLRSYVQSTQDWGDVTLLAVIIRATNNLNNQTQQKFNVIATRKLPTFGSGADLTTDLAPTRSIVLAFIDVFRAKYGGRVLDKFFDLEKLILLDALYISRGDYFDWIFRDPITVWEAAQTIARAGRAVPILVGSRITMVRDTPQEIPVAMFTPDNIVAGSLEYDVQLWDLDEFDSIKVEYTEPATGYKQETVICTLPGGTANNPQDVRFAGIQDRNQAYREGLYTRACQLNIRESIQLVTGLEGYIPSYGDLVAIAHDMPRWGQSGFVVEGARESGNHEYFIWLSEPLRWEDSGEHQVLFRGRKGEVIGPFTAIQTGNDSQIIVNITETGTFDFLLGGENEPMLFLFGPVGSITKLGRIVEIQPQGGENIRLTIANDAPVVHSFDALVAPALAQVPRPPKAPDLPTVNTIYVHQSDPSLQIVQVSWTAAFGAQYYVVQTSEDGALWQSRVTTVRTSLQVQARPGPFWVRVAGVNSGQGPWTVKNVNLSAILGLDLLIPWVDLEWKIGWFPVADASAYQVKLFTNDSAHTLLVTKVVDTPYIDYTYAQALVDHTDLHRDLDVQVDVLFGITPEGAPVSMKLHNDIPTPATGLTATYLATESAGVLFRLSWTVPHLNDLHRIKIWTSDVPGFNPALTVPTVDETITNPGWAGIPTHTDVLIPFDSSGGTWDHYWRVGLFDVWGNEISTNVTAQQTIPHHP